MDNGKQVGVMLPFLDLYLGGTQFKIKIYLLSWQVFHILTFKYSYILYTVTMDWKKCVL